MPRQPASVAAIPREQMDFPHVKRPVEALIPYARNSRTHSDAQVATLAASIREFGFTNPILIDEHDNVIAGHGRIHAARKLKMEELPCIVVSGLSEVQRRALVIADNKTSLLSAWDEEMLVMELGDLASDGFDLTLTGFTLNEVNFLRDGWNPDETPIEKVQEDGGEMVVVLRITVEKSKAEDVKLVLRKALDGAGFAGTEIA